MQGGIEGAGLEEAAVEAEVKMGGVLTVIEVGGDEASEGVGLGVTEGRFHTFPVGLKHPFQQQYLTLLLLLLVMVVVINVVLPNGSPNLIV